MGQVAFDTLQASEDLETAGISREQAKAISLVVRRSHEVADVATKADIAEVKRDIADVRKDLSAEIADVRKDMAAQFEKTDAKIADVRKDIAAYAEKTDIKIGVLEKRFDRFEGKFDRLQWFLIVGVVGLLFKDVLPKLWGG